jgi:phenol/toluene 2-monooxygenase (NADH) P4/A4
MSVVALQEYVGDPLDAIAVYHGAQVLYVCWNKHLMFGAPFSLRVEPAMKFGDVVAQMIAPIISVHPDASKIDWSAAQWLRGDEPWTPVWDASVAENGIAHKDFVRFETPGLDGYKGLGI